MFGNFLNKIKFMKEITSYPSGAIDLIEGQSIYLKGNDIDTDRIIPARFLKCISFKNLGSQVFADDRNEEKGLHPFNQPENKNASILIVDKNFGCGSSREHAPQALMRWGIRGIIGESFAEIFYGNCLSIGIPCATILEKELKSLVSLIKSDATTNFKLDLRSQKLYSTKGKSWEISIEDSSREMLLSGRWDATLELIKEKERIEKVKKNLPYINNFKGIYS